MLSALSSLLNLLLRAEAGKASSSDTAAATLLNVLGPLHGSRILKYLPEPELESAAKLLAPEISQAATKPEVVVALNTMLLTGAAFTDGALFRPGTLYHITNADGFQAETGFSFADMAAAMCQKDILKVENISRLQTWIAACRPVPLGNFTGL